MNAFPLVDPLNTSAERAELLGQIKQAFGVVPHMFRAVANSPAALQSMWGSFGALGQGKLPTRLTEQIAVAVADRNRCDYCLAAHTALGMKAGASAAEMAAAQAGQGTDARSTAALSFALQLVDRRGQIEPGELACLRDAGFDDDAIVEIIAHVALNLFTNYVNIALAVPVDFPPVKLLRRA